jgi:hypothetical protein
MSLHPLFDDILRAHFPQLKCEREPLDQPSDPKQPSPRSGDALAPWIGHPREAEFEHFVAKQEALAAACTCECDGGYGDDGSECRRTPKRGCPTHAEEHTDSGVFDEPHASDCAYWCDEPCDCSTRFLDRVDALLDDAMITVEARPLDLKEGKA